ncbi:MAG: hypothetical protein JOY93_04475 [Acidobacteriales bacterium]|nr:hypothetical protein [Terriglobales bacterium]
MNFTRALWYYLWIAPHAFQALILPAMLYHRLHRRYPAFFTYTAFAIVEFLWFFLVARFQPAGYLRGYSIDLLVSTILRFAVLCEVIVNLFGDYKSLRRVGKRLMAGGLAVFFVAATLLAVFVPGQNSDHSWWSVFVMDRTASILQCGLLLLLFLFSRYIGLSWRSPAFGIALGLGVFACVEFAISAIRAQFGSAQRIPLDLTSMLTYHFCVLIWLFYTWMPERKPAASAMAIPEHDLEAWNTELQRLVQR